MALNQSGHWVRNEDKLWYFRHGCHFKPAMDQIKLHRKFIENTKKILKNSKNRNLKSAFSVFLCQYRFLIQVWWTITPLHRTYPTFVPVENFWRAQNQPNQSFFAFFAIFTSQKISINNYVTWMLCNGVIVHHTCITNRYLKKISIKADFKLLFFEFLRIFFVFSMNFLCNLIWPMAGL